MEKTITIKVLLKDIIKQHLLDEKIEDELIKLGYDLENINWDSQNIENKEITITLDLYGGGE